MRFGTLPIEKFIIQYMTSYNDIICLHPYMYLSLVQAVDNPIAQDKASVLRHLWYLTEHLVIFSLFDQSVDSEVKEIMAMLLHNTPRPQHFPTRKPEFPTDIL